VSHWTGLYPKAKVHTERSSTGNSGWTLCRVRIEYGWVETKGPTTCKNCLKQARIRAELIA